MNPFRIVCPTCRARLKIVDPSAIGQIIACPKCNSMVQAVPPDDWSADGPVTTDSIVLGGSMTVGVVNIAAAVSGPPPSNAPAVGATGRAVPPPLPAPLPRVKTAGPNVPLSTAPAVTAPTVTAPTVTAPAVTASTVTLRARTGIRWFWPVFGGATAVSVAVAALVIFHNRKDRSEPLVADVAPRAKQTAQDRPTPPTGEANAAATKPPETHSAASEKTLAADPPANPPAVPSVANPAAKQPAAADASSKVAAEPPPKSSPESATDHADRLPAAKTSAITAEPPAASAAPPKSNEAADRNAEMPAAAGSEKPNPQPAPADVAMPNGPAARPVRPSVEKVPPRAVDVETHLTDPVAGVNYRAIPLVQLLAELSQLSTIPINVDADALAELNVAPNAPVTLRTKQTTVAGVLDEALTRFGLSYSVVGHQLVITRPPQEELRRVRYTVSDLAGETADSNAAFAALIQTIVDPAAWKQAGGKATGQWIDGALVVTAAESTHAQLLVFCEKLRVARGLPLRSKIDPARFRLEPRTAAAAAMLAEPVTANFGRPESLARILSYLRGTTQLTLLVDHAALADQRTSIDMEGTLAADHQPLGQTLTALLEPMELTWRVVGPRAIEITTPQAAARHGEIEFYPAGELAIDNGGEALVARISREAVAGADGDPQAPRPVIRFDTASRALIVRAPQSLQLRVAALLNEWRVAKK